MDYGIYRGTCVDARDPQNLGRVRVQVPRILGASATGWAFPAWSLGDLDIWPEDRLPKAGQGVWVAFESLDRMVWIAAFGPQEMSLQKLDTALDPGTGLPIAYRTGISWDLSVLPPDVPMVVPGRMRPGPDRSSKSHVKMQRHPPSADRPSGDSPLWATRKTAVVDASDDSFQFTYTARDGDEGSWYRAVYEGDGLYWPCMTEPYRPPVPLYSSVLEIVVPPTGHLQWKQVRTLTGVLYSTDSPQQGSSVDTISGEKVLLMLSPDDGATWVMDPASTITDRRGRWTLNWLWEEKYEKSLLLKAVYPGGAKYGFSESGTVVAPDPVVATSLTMTMPVQKPVLDSIADITGTIYTDDFHKVPERIRTVHLEIDPGDGAWRRAATVSASDKGIIRIPHRFTDIEASYRLVFDGSGAYQPSVSGTVYLSIQTGTSVSALNMPSSVQYLRSFVVTGSTADELGRPLQKASLRLMQSVDMGANWTLSALGSVSPTSNGAFSITATANTLGTIMYRAEVLPSEVLQESTSPVSALVSSMAAPVLVNGAISHTSASVSWGAVEGAVDYQVDVNGTISTSTVRSVTRTGLAHNSNTTFRVRARAYVRGADVFSPWSATSTASTGVPESRNTGNLTRTLAPTGTGTWRANDGNWSYNGNMVAQGYYSSSSASGFGIMTYNGHAFRQWVVDNYGWGVLNNLSYNSASVRMLRNTTSFTGDGPAVNTFWWCTATGAHENTGGRAPTLAGKTQADGRYSLDLGETVDVGIPNMALVIHVLRSDVLEWTGGRAVQSLAIHDQGTSNYARFYGSDSGYCSLSVECSWNFVTVPYVAPRWR